MKVTTHEWMGKHGENPWSLNADLPLHERSTHMQPCLFGICKQDAESPVAGWKHLTKNKLFWLIPKSMHATCHSLFCLTGPFTYSNSRKDGPNSTSSASWSRWLGQFGKLFYQLIEQTPNTHKHQFWHISKPWRFYAQVVTVGSHLSLQICGKQYSSKTTVTPSQFE